MVRLTESGREICLRLFPCPGDRHVLLHSAKTVLSRYGGADSNTQSRVWAATTGISQITSSIAGPITMSDV